MSSCIWIATRKGLFRTDRTPSGWKISGTHFLGDHLTIVLPDRRDGALYACFYHGHFGVKVQRSLDSGGTWQETPVPAYPPQPEGEQELDFWGKPRPWKLDRIWALEPGNPDQPGLLWCGTLPGGLFRSNDRGQSWEIVESLWRHPQRKEWFGGGADLPGIHSVCVDPRDGRKVAVGVSCGGVWVTEDAAQTWNCRADGMWAAYMPPEQQKNPNIQDVHRLVRCPALPDVFWAQHHNGVFRSTDGAASWHEIKDIPPSVFGFAVAVHPKDPDTAWFVPGVKDDQRIPVDGKVVVARTRDGGRSFTVLRTGLPQEHAYDLTFRHGLDVDETGDSLVFGSTTGSCWISENQGDTWQCLSEHLPPIHCVRFG